MLRYPLLEQQQKERVAIILLYSVPPTKATLYTSISKSTINYICRNLYKYNTINVLIEYYSVLGPLVKVIKQALLGL